MKPVGAHLSRTFLVLSLISGFACAAIAQASGVFLPAGNMMTPRAWHTATLLMNGKVLITGYGAATGELYDPATGTFTATGEMTTRRFDNSATMLPDGRVLIVGGYYSRPLTTAEIYNPSTNTFTAAGNIPGGQLTLLNDGKVLITGRGIDCANGRDGCALIEPPGIYDPATGTLSPTGDYADKTPDPWFANAGLVGAPTLLLPDGRVLIASEPIAELYDPVTGTFSLTGQMTRYNPDGHAPTWNIGGTLTLLTNGKVLLAGGDIFEFSWLADAELYDPASGKFTANPKMNRIRSNHTATLLSDGTVLIAGGDHTCSFQTSGGDVLRCDAEDIGTEIYDPSTNTFNAGPNMISGHWSHTATLLMDGRVLIAGGNTDLRGFWPTQSAEIYVPALLPPAPIVNEFRLDRANVAAGASYSDAVSGSNLNSNTFFDVRFTGPDNAAGVVLNWQQGLAGNHGVPDATTKGRWTITGVRAHQLATDHTGNFIPVSATLTVF